MIEFSSPLHKGTLVRRYKRFFADVILEDGSMVVAHCPNTGTMHTCAEPGAEVLLTKSDSPTRKLKYTWELTKGLGGWIGVNTHRTNSIVHAAISQGFFPQWAGCQVVAEVKWKDGTRFDFGIRGPNGDFDHLIEVKNVTLLASHTAIFPDCKSDRARKHAEELVAVRQSGRQATLLFVVNRPEGDVFRPAWDIDPAYSLALVEAQRQGVQIQAIRCMHDLAGSRLTHPVRIDLTAISKKPEKSASHESA